MKEEEDVLKKVGRDNAFKVPEGYFESLTSEIMDKLPENQQPILKVKEVSRWDKFKPLLYMAAMFVGAALIIRVALTDHRSDSTGVATATEAKPIDTESDEYINAVVEGSMMDDYSLYVYLTDASVD